MKDEITVRFFLVSGMVSQLSSCKWAIKNLIIGTKSVDNQEDFATRRKFN